MKEADSDYWNDKIEVIDSSYLPGSANYRRIVLAKKFISQKQTQKQYRSILDCGCGTGDSLQILAPIFEKSFGTDFSERMLEVASARSNVTSRPEFFLWDINRAFPRENWQRVDVVTLFSVLPYVENWSTFFDELTRILHPGGLFVATFPNELFDLYSLNTLTTSFFINELLDKNISEETNQRVGSDLNSLFSDRCPRFRKESAYSSSDILFKRLNPLTLPQVLRRYGVLVEGIYFMNNHPVPPSMKEFDSDEIRTIKMERELDLDHNHWSQFFTNSTFMVVGEYCPVSHVCAIGS